MTEGDGKVIETYPSIFERRSLQDLKRSIRAEINGKSWKKDKTIERYMFNSGVHIFEQYLDCLKTCTLQRFYFKILEKSFITESYLPSFLITFIIEKGTPRHYSLDARTLNVPSIGEMGIAGHFANKFSNKIKVPNKTIHEVNSFVYEIFASNHIMNAVQYGISTQIKASMETEDFKEKLALARAFAFKERFLILLNEFPEYAGKKEIIDLWNEHNIDLLMSC